MISIASPLCRIAQYTPATRKGGRNGMQTEGLTSMLKRVRQLGFDSLLWSDRVGQPSAAAGSWKQGMEGRLAEISSACGEAELALLVDVVCAPAAASHSLQACQEEVLRYVELGASGVRCIGFDSVEPGHWRQFQRSVREHAPEVLLTVWTPGFSREGLNQLKDAGFDGCFSSLAWWDHRSSWLVEEFELLRHLAPVIAPLVVAEGTAPLDPRLLVGRGTLLQRLWLAAYTGHGLMLEMSHVLDPALADDIRDANRWIVRGRSARGRLALLSGPLSRDVVLYWTGGAPYALLLHECDEQGLDAALDMLRARLPDGFVVTGSPAKQFVWRSHGVSLIPVRRSVPVKARHIAAADRTESGPSGRVSGSVGTHSRWALKQAMMADRIVIDGVAPQVDNGRFAVKRILGRALEVRARIYMDGHAKLDAALLWRAADQNQWQRVPMRFHGNDVWTAQCVPEQLGRHYYTIQAWVDTDGQAHRTRHGTIFPLQIERREAEYSSWYELFPRSMGKPGEHGRFQDVIAHLPRIQAMGFDVLYFPPIHPIGTKNRKGRNNSLTAQPGDPGSPYAIGSEDGGHDAIHPELGTLDDFRALVMAARSHDLEIALDFAIQCSPDHPWLREHPEWFKWRADGTVQYAENPPKRYEDIVNPDFYSTTAGPGQRMALWRALRDVVLFWAEQGVRIFRVDNPHTKPLPFWEWMIAEVHRYHPDALFLSEAFTRPAMMHRLAKLGFSQSYTYFTWRNTKAELTDYLTEIASPDQLDYFRPHFFVNTPDINPYFLQTSGRAGFLIRAAVAATSSGLFGVYSGFELCEAQPLPGKEEYLDAEKYELRSRDWDQPGNIVAELTRLNAIRRANPALQTHRGIRFYETGEGRVLFFSKATREEDNIVLVAISLSPGESVSLTLDIPEWIRGRTERGEVRLRSLWDDRVELARQGRLHLALTPGLPFVLWSVLP